jgi:tRNA-uridine 2-sulfurtransferase
MRVVCAMSGGVDSSVTASLLRDAGHEVIGLTMRLYDASADERRGRGGTCCSPAEVDLARRACALLRIPHYVVDERDRFEREVIRPFALDYAAGRTPNPCTRCNQHVKFGPLLGRARALGANVLATGHYARNEYGQALRRGIDASKDQSYFLFSMGRQTLAHVWFPLGTWTKAEVRERAAALGLPNHDAPDSQELCFVPSGDHGTVVERTLATLGRSTAALAPGPVLDVAGRVVGEHQGIHRVTVGQRRGFRTEGTERRYVLRIVPEQRAIVVGDPGEAQSEVVEVGEVRRMAWREETTCDEAWVQLRHRSPPARARVRLEGARARVELHEPVAAVAPGQAAVFYDGDGRVLGGGWITASA